MPDIIEIHDGLVHLVNRQVQKSITLDDFHILADHPTSAASVLTLRRGPG